MISPRIVIALDPERVAPEAIEFGHALGVATGAPLTRLAVAAREELAHAVARHHGPLGAEMLGSVPRSLLHRAACPLMVIPRGRERRLERLLRGVGRRTRKLTP